MSIRTHLFLKEITMILLLWIIGSVSAYFEGICINSTAYTDRLLGIPTEYTFDAQHDPEYDFYDEAQEYWAGETDNDGNCIEPFFNTYSCDPLD